MPRLLRSVGAFALAMTLLALVPSLASAAPRWPAPADLTPPGTAVGDPVDAGVLRVRAGDWHPPPTA